MPQQDDLFPVQPLSVNVPKDMIEPRLWVRRLKVWEAPGGPIIRDIELRPGLNIIWSPDGTDESEPINERKIGHGSGKTLFCRLLRYSLGETRFADEIQRDAISTTYLNGVVGAEVILDGTCWAVARPLGSGRKHFAIAGGMLDDVAKMDGVATGIDPLVDAIESSILTLSVAKLARLPAGQGAWPVALAWLARDQECRFDDVLDWRSPSSGSDTPQPASGDAKGPRLQALRAFLMAITDAEQSARGIEEGLSDELDAAKKQSAFLEWDQKRQLKRLIDDLRLAEDTQPDTPFLMNNLKEAADQRLVAAAQLPKADQSELSKARTALKKARARLREVELKIAGINAKIPVEARLLVQLNSETPALSAAVGMSGSPVCPLCEIPLDTALIEGCKLSHKLPDADQCRARLEAKRADISEQEQTVESLRAQLDALKPETALAAQAVQTAEDQVRKLEKAADLRNSKWRSATRLVDEVRRCSDQNRELDEAKAASKSLEGKLQTARNKLRMFEDKQAKTVGGISDKFSAIVRSLLGQNSKGTVRLTGQGLSAQIHAGGDRRTAAMESLKVLAFDVACMCLSIEKRTSVPAFFVHDSPREADLGLTIYDEHFRLIRALEGSLAGPVFQYIVTTTTRPPEELNREPWLRAVLQGTPGSERLLRCDL